MVSPTDQMFDSSSATIMEHPLSDERDISEIELSKRKLNCTHRYYQSLQQTKTTMSNEQSTDSIWTSSDDHRIDFYPDSYSSSSSSSIFSFDLHSNNNNSHHITIPGLQTFSSSSGYDSSLHSIPDHFFPPSPDSIPIPDCNFIEQFTNLHLDNQSSSFSQEPISPLFYRKCLHTNQVSSDTDDDFQQENNRPRSLPIAIQQSKNLLNDNCHCTYISPKKRSRTCELTTIKSENRLQLHINEQVIINEKISLEHFIMSPTDKVKIQMKYQENDIKNNELKISQPEEMDFKRSKLKAIRILYQNRFHLNSIQSSVGNSTGYCHSPLAKRTINPRLLRSVISCSVFEADDEHEVVSSSTPTGVNGRHEKPPIETFNCLHINFTESLLHGKILPCGILDGFTIKLGASGLFIPKQVVLPVTTFWFNISEHQAASPYLGFINLQCLPKRGYHTPIKGTITLALLNPNRTAIHLFLILYDLSDMPPDHRTFIRQRVVLISENIDDKKQNLRYLAHIRFVTSQTGKLYMHSDIRLIFARNKLDYDERTGNGKPQLITFTDMPTPKYWSRK